MRYDAIIIGSGSAGGVLAERLSRGTPANQPRVLLLEAGLDWTERPFDASGLVGGVPSDPALARRTAIRANATQDHPSDHEHWPYEDEFGQHHDYAKHVGGSSAHNGSQSMTGTRIDHDRWPAGWKYDDMKPFYDAVISRMNVRPRPRLTMDPGARAFELSARSLGIPGVEDLGADFNDAYARSGQDRDRAFSSAVGPTTANIRDLMGNNNGGMVDKYGGRQSVLETFIEDSRGRPGLTIRPFAWAREVNFRSDGAGGFSAESVTVVDQRTGAEETVEAGLVISCANVLGSPGLLMRSNIGPKVNPRSSNPHVRLSHVGQHYNNQPILLVGAVYNLEIHPQFGYTVPITVNRHYDDLPRSAAMGVLNNAHPTIGAALTEWGIGFKEQARLWRRMQFGFVFRTHPVSRGTLTLDESKPNSVDISFPVAQEDFTVLQAAAAELRAIFENIGSTRLPRDLAGLRVERTFLLPGYGIASHGIETCRMGSGPDDSVVDPATLLVHGFDNLMIVDGSIFPSQVQSPHVPISAVAFKAAETIVRPRLGLPQATGL